MRILYIGDTLEPTSGVAQKIVMQATEWQRQAHTVWVATTRTPLPRDPDTIAAQMSARPGQLGLRARIRREAEVRLLYPSRLRGAVRALGIDVIYSRELPLAPGLSGLTRCAAFVLELNGDIARERKGGLQTASRVHSRNLQLSAADGVVFVSNELRGTCRPAPKRSLVLGNPSLPAAGAGTHCVPRPARPTLVFIGSGRQAWVGVDKVVDLARALPDLDFVMVGEEVSGPGNLQCYPRLPQIEADRVMSGCTVGIGSLASYRKGVSEASPLKSRNYLALGLPVIQAYRDTDLSEADECILELPNTEDNVATSLARIRAFALRAFQDPSLSRAAIALAQGRLSLAEKERKRLAFMEECLQSRRR